MAMVWLVAKSSLHFDFAQVMDYKLVLWAQVDPLFCCFLLVYFIASRENPQTLHDVEGCAKGPPVSTDLEIVSISVTQCCGY